MTRILWVMLTVAGVWLLSSIQANAQPPPHITAKVQERLIASGYYPGRVDGVWGRRTANELIRYQLDHRLPATGELDPPTMQSLGLAHGIRPYPPSQYPEPPPPSYREPVPPGPPPYDAPPIPGPRPPYPPPPY